LFKKAISAIGAIGAMGAMGAIGAIGAIGACGGSAFVLAGAPVLVKIVFVDCFFLKFGVLVPGCVFLSGSRSSSRCS
jgi:hypothetical protein